MEQYAAQYSGLARLNRLMFIADHCPSLRIEALRMALNYVLTTYNTNLYGIIHRKLQEAAALWVLFVKIAMKYIIFVLHLLVSSKII